MLKFKHLIASGLAALALSPFFAARADDADDDKLAGEALNFLAPNEVTKDGDLDTEHYVGLLVVTKRVKVTRTEGAGTKPGNPFAEGDAASGTEGKTPLPQKGRAAADSPVAAPKSDTTPSAAGASKVEFTSPKAEAPRKPAAVQPPARPKPEPDNATATFTAPRARL